MQNYVIDLLLIEDNPNDIELTIHALKLRRIANNITVISDGAEAMDFVEGKGLYAGRDLAIKPKVILLDLKLPKVSGLEILKKIKSQPETKNIPVVVLTSSKEEKDVAECYESGVNSFIVKPVNFENFVEAVGKLGLYWLLLNEPLT